MIPSLETFDILLTVSLLVYAGIVVLLTKYVFNIMVKKGINQDDAIYYNRKFVHIFAGGIIALFVPLFSTEWYPLFAGFLLTILTYLSHKRGRDMYWFQTKKDFRIQLE